MYFSILTETFDHRLVQGGVVVTHRQSGRCLYCHDNKDWRVSEMFRDGATLMMRESEADLVAKAAHQFAESLKKI